MKDFISFLSQYNEEVLPVVEDFFSKEKQEEVLVDPQFSKMIDDYQDFLTGGKKLRGSLIKLGYEMFGGTDLKLALRASLFVEIVHAFFLIHDDIMDQDVLRRNKPTMHIRYSKEYGEHFGVSAALNLGDIGVFLAYKLLALLDTSSEIKNRIAALMSQVFLEVGLGQTLDISFEKQKKLNEEDVIKIHRYKTADYTISAPLAMGALLAGVDRYYLEKIKNFGIAVGIAFQIRDDELGLLSTEEELGKPVGSDFKEGKITLLIVKALEHSSPEDQKFFRYTHGNQHLTNEEVDKVRRIIQEGGALDYSQKTAREFVEKGKGYIPDVTNDPYYRKLLTELADFVIERKS